MRARVGIKIVSLSSGKVVFENDAEKYFMPASNMKNFTVAAALEKLGPDFKFITSVYAPAVPDGSGTVKGDLRILDRGDVSYSTLFDNGDYYKGLDDLANKITAAGVKRVEGAIVADESYFRGNAIPISWEWDDLQWDDGAEVSAFPINNNAVDLNVRGGSSGQPCTVSLLPLNTLYQVINTCTTTATGTKRSLTVKKSLERNSVVISGTLPAGDTFTGYLSVSHPAELFVTLLKERLERKGVVITGGARVLPPGAASAMTSLEIAKRESPPFSRVAALTMKPSQNMFTEVILWTMGEELGRKSGGSGDSAALGIGIVKGFLNNAGIPADSVVQHDGSGLSRHNLVSPSAVVQLYGYMAKSRYSQAWRDSLTIGGVDGTLRNRFKGTAAAGNIRGKTGTLDQVSALSGYVTTAAGEQLIVSIIVNGMPEPPKRVALIDDIIVRLANFTGKIDQ
jgi:D-alanyl-D-alanine carboxypeptidase/D-alanyl-D-alanine-endopeptidase (penicillin-binding protein 4)